MTIELVPATSTHREFITQLSAEVFTRFGDYDVTLPGLIGVSWILTVVAETEGRPVGFAMLSLETDEADLVAIAVTPSMQRRGIARRLLEHVEEQVHSGPITLTVAEDNLPARRLFESAGFSVVADESGRYPGGQRSVRMYKKPR